MKHRIAVIAAVVPLCAGLVLATSPGFAGQSAARRSTTYAFKSSGYGTHVLGGQLPAGSQTTAFKVIGCTNQAGVRHENDVAQADVPGLGTASGIKTRVWTTDKNGVAASHSTHTIAHLNLASTPLGTLSLDAIKAQALAFHDDSGFHSTASTSLGGITFTPPIGPAQSFPAPSPGQPIDIPGVANIYLGRTQLSHSGTGAEAQAIALRIDVIPTGTSVRVAHAHAEIDSGLTYGIFSGHSDAASVPTAVSGILKSGPNPLTIMPCQGTQGAVRAKSLAHVNLGGQLVVKGLSSRERANQNAHGAHGYERGSVAGINLGDGQLVVNAIVGKASVRRDGHGTRLSAKGTRLGSVTVAGQTETFPPTGVLEIPGVAKLERKVVTRTATGIHVIALRITLLDGTGAVVDLGEANLRLKKLSH
jgi:hypothetical protein